MIPAIDPPLGSILLSYLGTLLSMDNSPSLARFADDILIRLITMRRQDALTELYTRYSPLVFGLALQMLRQDRASAEEVTLDVFVNVWQHAASYQSTHAKVSTWLTSIARHRCIDRLRMLRVRPEGHLVEFNELTIDSEAALASDLGTDLMLRRERVQSALRELPEEQAEVLVLAYYYGFSQSEIAAALDLSIGTIKTRARLALQKLRKLLGEEI